MNAKPYAQAVIEDRRLRLLQVLRESAGYQAAAPLLQQVLPGMGHAVGLDRVNTDLAWLAEQGLVTLDTAGGLRLAMLTQSGEDVARGLSEVPGVARPRPGE